MKQLRILALMLLVSLAASAQTDKELYILHTSDTHSRIEPIPTKAADEYAGMAGVVRRVTLVKQQRQQHPALLLLDCGDISQGTPYYNLFRGELEVKMMNLMGYDAMAVGNHEFDFGLENMARLFRLAEFPVLAANLDVTGTVLEGLVKPYTVVEREGVRIGLFGLTPELAGLVQEKNCEGVTWLDPVASAQKTVDVLREEEGCEVVICLSHLGVFWGRLDIVGDEQLLARTRGIDLLLGGHTHTFMEKPATYLNADGRNVFLYHSGRWGVHMGEVKLKLAEKKK